MKIKINKKSYELKYTMRMLIKYESITDGPLDFTDLTKYSNIISLLYSCISATMEAKGDTLDMSLDEFLQWIDDNGQEQLLTDFLSWFYHIYTVNTGLQKQKKTPQPTEEGSKEDPKKS